MAKIHLGASLILVIVVHAVTGYVVQYMCHMLCRWRPKYQRVAEDFLLARIHPEKYTWTLIAKEDYEAPLWSKTISGHNFTTEFPPIQQKLSPSTCVTMHVINPSDKNETEGIEEMWADAYLFYWYEWKPTSSLFFWVKETMDIGAPSMRWMEATEILCDVFYVVMAKNRKTKVYNFDKGHLMDQTPFRLINWENGLENLVSGSISLPPFNNNGKIVRIVDFNPASYRGIDCSRDYRGQICHQLDMELIEYTRKFNFLLIPVKENALVGFRAERPKLAFFTGMLEDDFDGIHSYTFGDSFPFTVHYCRKRPLLGTDWRVWFMPFETEVWIAVTLVFVIPAFLRINHGWKTSAFEVFQLFSYGVGGPVTNLPMTTSHIMLALLIPIIPMAYESVITGRIMAPMEAPSIDDVGQLMLANYKLFYYINSGYDSNETLRGYDNAPFQQEFSRFHVEDKFNSSFILTATNLPLNERKSVLFNTTAIIAGADEEFEHLYNKLATGDSKSFPCSYFHLQISTYPWFNTFYVPFATEIARVHDNLKEVGLTGLKRSFWFQNCIHKHKLGPIAALRVNSARESEEMVLREQQIVLKNLHEYDFFSLYGMCISLATLVWIIERFFIESAKTVWVRLVWYTVKYNLIL